MFNKHKKLLTAFFCAVAIGLCGQAMAGEYLDPVLPYNNYASEDPHQVLDALDEGYPVFASSYTNPLYYSDTYVTLPSYTTLPGSTVYYPVGAVTYSSASPLYVSSTSTQTLPGYLGTPMQNNMQYYIG